MSEAQLAEKQQTLNLFSERTKEPSRQTAGTTIAMPGKNPEYGLTSVSSTVKPALLPVSCGYFFNIVRQLLMK
jgi:hypothetical protein